MTSTLLLILGLLAGDPKTPREQPIVPAVADIIHELRFAESRWGFLVVDRSTGEVLQSRDPGKLFIPASVTKLFSTSAALDTLGADFRFQTPVYCRGKIDAGGTLNGDLVLVASGDPTMGGRTTENGAIAFTDNDHIYEHGAKLLETDPLAGLNALAKQIAAAGVKQIRGEVYIDDRLFETAESTGSGPKRVTPIMINDNVVDLIIKPTSPGRKAIVDWQPKTSRITVDADVDTKGASERTRLHITQPSAGRIVLRGKVTANADPKASHNHIRIVEVDDPTSFARGLFLEALQREGISTSASPLSNNPSLKALPTTWDDKDRLALLESPPFSENLRLILKVSHNLHASELPLLLAVHSEKRTLQQGLRLQRDALRRIGLDVSSISFGGGAGGSPADLVTPRATVDLLIAMSKRGDFGVFERALPVIGKDGTLAKVVEANSPVVGKVRAKTGTYWWHNGLNGSYVLTSKALAGYLTTAKSREVAFALFVNYVHMTNREERQAIAETLGKICEHWYNEL